MRFLSPRCEGDQYNAWTPWTLIMALLYSIGIPFLFFFLVRRYKDLGKRGDRVVSAALGWIEVCGLPLPNGRSTYS